VVKSVRVDDISELSLVPSISVYSMVWLFCVCWSYVLRWIWCLWCYSECASTPGKLYRFPRRSIPTVAKLTFQLARCGCTLRVTSQTSYSPEYITPTHTK
jgi:hypothetical protein